MTEPFDERVESPEDEAPDPSFVIDNLDKLTWAMEKLKLIADRIAEVNEVADRRVVPVEKWRAEQTSTLRAKAAFLEGLATAYARSQKAEGRSQLSTPYGVVRTSPTGNRAEVADKAAFTEYALKHHLDWLSHTPKLSALKDAVDHTEDGLIDTETGAEVPGLRYVPPGLSVTFSYPKED